MKKPEILRLIRLNFFKLLGAAIGLVLAILFLTLGFWRTMLIIVLVGGFGAAGAWTADRSFRMCWIAFSRDRRRTMRMNSSFNGS